MIIIIMTGIMRGLKAKNQVTCFLLQSSECIRICLKFDLITQSISKRNIATGNFDTCIYSDAYIGRKLEPKLIKHSFRHSRIFVL